MPGKADLVIARSDSDDSGGTYGNHELIQREQVRSAADADAECTATGLAENRRTGGDAGVVTKNDSPFLTGNGSIGISVQVCCDTDCNIWHAGVRCETADGHPNRNCAGTAG